VPEPMTSRERVRVALGGGTPDRPPVVNPTSVATVELMDLADARFPEANREPELMAALAATGHTELGFDTVMPVFSIIQESSALGCKIQWEQKDNWPTVKMTEPIYHSPSDISVDVDATLEHPDARCVIEAIEILRAELPDVAVIGKSMGPWSQAYHTMGVENFLLLSNDDEKMTFAVLEALKELTVEYANRQFAAGADAVTLPDHATGDLVSGEFYHRYLEELHQEFAERINGPIILHICGRTVDRMPYIANTGMAAFHFDSKNRPDESMAAVGDGIRLVGNVNNPETLFARGPDEVKEQVVACLDAGVQMVGPECACPLQTPIENLRAIPETVRDWSIKHG